MPGINFTKKRTWGTLTAVRVPPHLRIEIGKYAVRLEEDFGIALSTSSRWFGISRRTLVKWTKQWQHYPKIENIVALPTLGPTRAIVGPAYVMISPKTADNIPCSQPGPQLKQKLNDHQAWLESEGKKGQRFELGDNPWTDFSRFRLSRVKSSGAFLLFSKFAGARLDGSGLSGADCALANFYGADLRGVDLRKATLYGADFRKADLREANLDEAWAIGANFGGANIEGASLQGTVLCHYALRDNMKVYLATLGIANLVSFGKRVTTIITQSQLESAITGSGTIFPAGMGPQKSLHSTRIKSRVVIDYPLNLINSEI